MSHTTSKSPPIPAFAHVFYISIKTHPAESRVTSAVLSWSWWVPAVIFEWAKKYTSSHVSKQQTGFVHGSIKSVCWPDTDLILHHNITAVLWRGGREKQQNQLKSKLPGFLVHHRSENNGSVLCVEVCINQRTVADFIHWQSLFMICYFPL